MNIKGNGHPQRPNSVDKKMAVKLINNYAESYKKKEGENAFLQRSIRDLEQNLKLNKSIISTLTSQLPEKDKTSELIKKLSEEIRMLSSQNSDMRSQLEESNSKVSRNA